MAELTERKSMDEGYTEKGNEFPVILFCFACELGWVGFGWVFSTIISLSLSLSLFDFLRIVTQFKSVSGG